MVSAKMLRAKKSRHQNTNVGFVRDMSKIYRPIGWCLSSLAGPNLPDAPPMPSRIKLNLSFHRASRFRTQCHPLVAASSGVPFTSELIVALAALATLTCTISMPGGSAIGALLLGANF
jgi:hypothetical protein